MSKSGFIIDTPDNCMNCPLRHMDLQNQFICYISKHIIDDLNVRDSECKLIDGIEV